VSTFEVPADDTERRTLAARYQHDPSPEAGERFWRLAMPDIAAGFWATRRQMQAEAGGTP
jgi:hypothetical protein